MTQKDNIVQELRDLQSPLANYSQQNAYAVPAGYFDQLADQVLRKIRAMDAGTAAEELGHLSPLLSQAGKTIPYHLPQGYFEGLEDSLVSAAMHGQQAAGEELEILSPLLSGLKKDMPFSIPAGYFDNLTVPVTENKTAAKLVSMGGSRKWFRYAAAAVVTGVIALLGFLYLDRDNTGSSSGTSVAKFEKNILKEIRKTSDTVLNEFVKQFDEAGLSMEETAATDTHIEARELLKDIPETELKQFLDETADADAGAEETLFMN